MVPADEDRFKIALVQMFLACAKPVPTKYDNVAYRNVLVDLPIEWIEAGMIEAAKDVTDFRPLPRAKDVRDAAREEGKRRRDEERARRPRLAPVQGDHEIWPELPPDSAMAKRIAAATEALASRQWPGFVAKEGGQ